MLSAWTSTRHALHPHFLGYGLALQRSAELGSDPGWWIAVVPLADRLAGCAGFVVALRVGLPPAERFFLAKLGFPRNDDAVDAVLKLADTTRVDVGDPWGEQAAEFLDVAAEGLDELRG